jgi:hypothetical protein
MSRGAESLRAELAKVVARREKAAKKLFSSWFAPMLGERKLRKLQELRAREDELRAMLSE